MMSWVHASIGGYLGGEIGRRKRSWFAGAISHLLADLIPHRDYDLPVEMPLLAATLAFIAWRFGIRSPEMSGAIGAISPDIENGLERLGVIKGTVFPTHTSRKWFIGHGRKVRSPFPQIVLAAACLYLAHRRRPQR